MYLFSGADIGFGHSFAGNLDGKIGYYLMDAVGNISFGSCLLLHIYHVQYDMQQ